MIFNTTHQNKDDQKSIKNIIGNSYGFIESIKMKGIGSKRMMIDEVSPNFKTMMNLVSDINYGNIEIRKKGILVYINKGLQNFSWAIPFYQLHLYKTNGFSIHAQGNFIRFKNNKLLKENKKFLDKLLDLKIENDKNYEFQDHIN